MARKEEQGVRLGCVRNAYGIWVRRCCRSCAYKAMTRALSLRRCTKRRKDVNPDGVCKCWTMSEQLKRVGKG